MNHHPRAPGTWEERAACKKVGDIFVIPTTYKLSGPQLRRKMAPALEICANCPVIEQCYEWAMSEPDPAQYHVAGGHTPIERRQIRDECDRIMRRERA
jgi:WhiB family redox-sensing transcriptional regulator